MDMTGLIETLADLFGALPQVEAVALGGSRSASGLDEWSDVDLYVYTVAEIPLATRRAIVEQSGGASRADLGLTYWGPGDEWYHAPTGVEIDVVYFDAHWMEEQLTRVLDRHEPSLGYTTCFWYTMRHSRLLRDRRGWMAQQQVRCAVPYPAALQRAIVAYNHPVLREIIPSYAHQIAKAVRRGDLVSLNHRIAALMASYVDILLAVNAQLHPGEKRLLTYVQEHCSRLPEGVVEDCTAILMYTAQDIPTLPRRVDRLIDALDAWLMREGYL